MYKTLRLFCNYLEEKYINNIALIAELEKIRKILKRPACIPDVFTPTDEELNVTLSILKNIDYRIYNTYLGLMYSGVRIVELFYYMENNCKVHHMGSYKKIIMNYQRANKNCFYIYLPLNYEPSKLTWQYFHKVLQKHKEIIRPKYIRN